MTQVRRRFRPLLAAAFAATALPAAAQVVTLDLPAGADSGLRDVLESNSQVFSLLDQDGTTVADTIAAARADYRRLLTALYSEGYYGGTISIRVDGREAAAIAPLDAPASVGSVAIAIDPGPRFSFGTTALGPLAPETDLPEGFAPGEIARATLVQDAAAAGIEGWRQAGHPLAETAGQEIRADHRTDRLDVAVTLAPGPVLRFAPLDVAGNTAVRTERIIAIAGLPRGQVYDPDQVELAAQRLRRTGAFDSVAMIEGESAGPGDTLSVTAQVSERLPRRLGFGAEISSVDGLSVNAYWMHRNLFGGAERFRIDGAVTGIEGQSGGADYTISLSFGRPATINANTDLTADLAIERLDESDYLLSQVTGDVSLVKYVRDDLTYNFGLGFITAREETEFSRRDYTLLTAPIGGTLDARNDRFDATAGYYIDLSVTPFLGISGSDDGGRIYADARYYRSFGENDRVTLAVRGQVGSVWGADLLQAPRDFLFYSGGGGTVRGQPYQSLGIPIARAGGETDRVGGRSFLGAQLEARVNITPKIEIVGFYDFGAIDIDSLPDRDSDWHAGAGIGVRYATAIGPIRLDLAAPASGADAWDSVQVYIGIGQAF